MFKVILYYEKDLVIELKIKYFDIIFMMFVMCVLRFSFFFVVLEFGNYLLY